MNEAAPASSSFTSPFSTSSHSTSTPMPNTIVLAIVLRIRRTKAWRLNSLSLRLFGAAPESCATGASLCVTQAAGALGRIGPPGAAAQTRVYEQQRQLDQQQFGVDQAVDRALPPSRLGFAVPFQPVDIRRPVAGLVLFDDA